MTEIFKNFEELEEYFKNLGIEYRFSCYYEKNGEGCHLLGEYMSKIQNDIKRSVKVFKDNCDNNKYARSCTQFGVSLLLGKGVEKDVPKASEYFSKGCQLDDNEGCFYGGQLLAGEDPQYKDHIDRNIRKSMEFLEKGCSSDKNGLVSGECCFYAHTHYLKGKNGCEKDLTKALKLAQRGCDFDNIQSCNNLAQMYLLGMGTQVDQNLAKKYKNKTLEMLEQIEKQSQLEMQRT